MNTNAPGPVYPILSSGTSRLWISDVDPTANETVVLDIGNFWWNLTTPSLWICTDNTLNANVWHQIF